MITLRFKKLINPIFFTFAFLALVYFTFSYYSIGDRPWIFYNSDNIYVAYFYQDIVERGGHLLQWKFSPVPYFFPDIFIYFIIATLVHHLKIAILLQAIVQLALYYSLIVHIGKMVVNKNPILFHLSVFLSLALLATGHLQQETLQYALVTQQHFGTAIMFLLGMFFILRTFSSKSISNYMGLFLICFLTTFSDIVFVTQFFAPAVASLMIMLFLSEKSDKRIYIANLSVISLGTLSSYLLYRLKIFGLHLTINPHLLRRSHPSELIAATLKIKQNLMDFYQQNEVVIILLAVYALATSAILAAIILKRKKITDKTFVFAVLFLFMAMVTGYASLLFADNDLMEIGYNGMRHYQPYMLFPVFLGIPLYLTRYTSLPARILKYSNYIVLGIVCYVYLLSPPGGSIANILNFYPASVACLDNYTKQHHLQNGIANYWEAKSYTFLSRQTSVVAIENNRKEQSIHPEFWISTLHDYIGKKFDYLIVESDHPESADSEYIGKTFGEPQMQLECPAWENGKKDKIYVYKNGALDKWMQNEVEHPAYF